MRRTPAEEARTLVAGAASAALGTVAGDGAPWCSLVVYTTLADGTPVLNLSTLAEHGRNVRRDPRASLMVAEPADADDPLDRGRLTLAGRLETAPGEAPPFADFTRYALRIERIRWVGGYGRMDWVDPAAYAAAEPDPVAPRAAGAVRHLNADHADALLAMARALAGHPDATAARCVRADRYGLDLEVATPGGAALARVAFATPVTAADGLRAATVELARRAR
jgi:putative heme iron utilization protein